jgi:hypothetical protein
VRRFIAVLARGPAVRAIPQANKTNRVSADANCAIVGINEIHIEERRGIWTEQLHFPGRGFPSPEHCWHWDVLRCVRDSGALATTRTKKAPC